MPDGISVAMACLILQRFSEKENDALLPKNKLLGSIQDLVPLLHLLHTQSLSRKPTAQNAYFVKNQVLARSHCTRYSHSQSWCSRQTVCFHASGWETFSQTERWRSCFHRSPISRALLGISVQESASCSTRESGGGCLATRWYCTCRACCLHRKEAFRQY